MRGRGRRPSRNQSTGASISDSSCRDRRRRAWPVSLPRRALGGRGAPCSGRSLRRAPGPGPRTPQTQARWPGHHSDQQVLLKAGCGDGLGRERHPPASWRGPARGSGPRVLLVRAWARRRPPPSTGASGGTAGAVPLPAPSTTPFRIFGQSELLATRRFPAPADRALLTMVTRPRAAGERRVSPRGSRASHVFAAGSRCTAFACSAEFGLLSQRVRSLPLSFMGSAVPFALILGSG